MKRILIATIYSDEPVTVSATRLGIDKLILLIDDNPDNKQQEAIDIVKKAVGPIVDARKTEVYNIVKVAEEVVKIIDDLDEDDEIYINITAGRKTKALGLLFASYVRSNKIKKIVYVTEETKEMIVLPKLSFNLKPTQKKILEYIGDNAVCSIMKASENIGMSRSILYSNIDELKDMGLIESKDKIRLTDAGRIARL